MNCMRKNAKQRRRDRTGGGNEAVVRQARTLAESKTVDLVRVLQRVTTGLVGQPVEQSFYRPSRETRRTTFLIEKY